MGIKRVRADYTLIEMGEGSTPKISREEDTAWVVERAGGFVTLTDKTMNGKDTIYKRTSGQRGNG